MALVKGRTCAESCLELLTIELVRFYYSQELVPPELAIEAIGNIEHINSHVFLHYCLFKGQRPVTN